MAIRDRITQFVTYLVKQIKCSQGGILIGRVTGEGKAQEITVGSGLTLSGTTLTVTGGPFAAASHTHVSSSITDAVSDATVEGSEGKLLKTANDGSLSLSFVFADSAQASEMTVGSVGTNGVLWILGNGSPGGINNANQVNGLQFSLPTTSGNLAVTDRTDGAVSYNDLVDVPTTVPLTSSKVVANAAARLALTTEQAEGFAVVDADTGKTWMLVAGGTPATSSDWLQLGDRDITAADITDASASGKTVLTGTPAEGRVALGLGSSATESARYINVKSAPYNAVGDNTNDDTAEIQAAITAGAAAGRPVFIPSGTYKLSDALTVPSGTTIIGESWDSTELVQTGSNKNVFNLSSDDPQYGSVHLENLLLTGPGKALTTGCGLYFDGSHIGQTNGINNSTFRKIQSRRFDKGAYFHTLDNSLIEQCRFGNTGNENNVGLEITGNSNAVSLVSNTIFSSTLGLKISGGGAIGIRGLEMGGGGQTKAIELSGSCQVAIRDLNVEYWPDGGSNSASNVCIDATAAGISLLLENASIRAGSTGSGYSLAVGTGRVMVINSGLSLTYNDAGKTGAVKLLTHYQSLLNGYNTPAVVNIYHETTGVFQTRAMLSQFPADAATPAAATSATRGRLLWKHFPDGSGYDDGLLAAVETSAGTFADANLLDYFSDKKNTGLGTLPAFVGIANTFAKNQNVFHSDTTYQSGYYFGSSGASGSARGFLGEIRNAGYGATGTAVGDSVMIAKAGGALDFATSVSGTQIVRGKFKAAGMLHLVPMGEPTGAAGDIYYDSTSNKLRCHNGTDWQDLF